jgi:CheY-like chemotaxis protein
MTLRILVAGSNPAVTELVKRAYAGQDCAIIPVNGVALGLFLAHKNFPHVILSDLQMIDGSGMDLLAQVRQDPDLSAIPFVFLCSSECNSDTMNRARALGAAKFLCYPISSQELTGQLAPYLVEREKEREPETPE